MILTSPAKTAFARFCLSKITGVIILGVGSAAVAAPYPTSSLNQSTDSFDQQVSTIDHVPSDTLEPYVIDPPVNNQIEQPVNPIPNQSSPASPQVILLRQAIIGQESGANFRAVNRHSGALGYAQVMPENLPRWSREALGYVVSRQEFLNRPDLQIAIVDHRLNLYWQRSLIASNGNEALAVQRVAAWWYSGKPERYTSYSQQYYNGHRYPSIAAYTQSVLRRYRSLANSQDASIARPTSILPGG